MIMAAYTVMAQEDADDVDEEIINEDIDQIQNDDITAATDAAESTGFDQINLDYEKAAEEFFSKQGQVYLLDLEDVDYSQSGDNWEGLCATGLEQSPIDLFALTEENYNESVWSSSKMSLVGYDYEYYQVPRFDPALQRGQRFQDRFSVQFPVAPWTSGHYDLTYYDEKETRFYAQSFTFHQPSEHTFDGEHKDLELQIMHKDIETGQIGMLVLFFDRDEGNFDNEFIRALFDPDPDYMTSKLSDILVLSSFETYWNYMGSLTVPPCTENVSWTIV